MSPPPEGIEDRAGDQHIRAVVIHRADFNLQLLLTVPFCLVLGLLGVVGLREGVRGGSPGAVLLALAAIVAVLLLAWPTASTLFGRESLTLDRDQLCWRREIGRFGFTRRVPLLGLAGMSVQHLGVMAISPADVGWCLSIAAHRPYGSITVAAGFGYDKESLDWLADHFRAGLESIARSED